MKNLKVRIPMYFIGLFIMTIGIAISVKSNMGVSPVSSIPYTMTCVWGIEMGKATIILHVFLVLLQILLLRKKFKPINLLQVFVGIIFGYFTTFCNYMASFFPTPDNIGIRIAMMLVSTAFIAMGIFLYLPANLIPLAGEGAMQAISDITKIEFAKVKIGFDCTMVMISAVTCLTLLKSLGSVGIGTVIAAVLVGMLVGVFTRAFGKQRDELLQRGIVQDDATKKEHEHYVITISREFGSGGRQIGKLLADKLGFHYYDSELIKLAAQKSGYSLEYVERNEQALKNPIFHDFFAWYSGSVERSYQPKENQLFHMEEEIIKGLTKKHCCVIVGRLSNYILRENERAYHVFISADEETEMLRVANRDSISLREAKTKVRKVNHEREIHCKYFTQTEWGNAKNYNFSIKSDDFGIEETAQIIEEMFRKKFNKKSA